MYVLRFSEISFKYTTELFVCFSIDSSKIVFNSRIFDLIKSTFLSLLDEILSNKLSI